MAVRLGNGVLWVVGGMSEPLGAGGGGGGGGFPGGEQAPPFAPFSEDGEPRSQDARLLDISWDYYERQPQYRPWEPQPAGLGPVLPGKDVALRGGFADSKLPSFQSQFHAFSEPTSDLAPSAVGVSSPGPAPSPSTLTPLAPATFHPLATVNPRAYALPLAPQYMDERHILYQPNLTLNFQPQNGLLHQNGALLQNISNQTVVHVLKNEQPSFEMKIGNTTIPITQDTKFIPSNLHPSDFQNPITLMDNAYDKSKSDVFQNGTSPTRSDFRKKERRKMRANSLESNGESDGSGMEVGTESGQVAAVSSTGGAGGAGRRLGGSQLPSGPSTHTSLSDMDDISSDKQVTTLQYHYISFF